MAWQDEMKTDLAAKELKDLTSTKAPGPTLGSNLILPTKGEQALIVEALRAGQSLQEIKSSVKRGTLKFSIDQLAEAQKIYLEALSAKTASADPKAVEGEIKP